MIKIVKNTPLFGKILINTLLYGIYTFFSITSISFFYGFFLTAMDIVVPGPEDFIHIKIASAVAFFVLIITLLLRKYCYFPGIFSQKKMGKKKKSVRKSVKSRKNNEMEIYIDKEIQKGK